MTFQVSNPALVRFFLPFFALALFSGQTKPAAPAPAATYTDTNQGFSINAPNLGKAVTVVTPVIFNGPAANGFAPNVNVIVQFVKTTRQAYLADSLSSLPQINGTLVASKELQVSGKDAAIMEYTAKLGGRDVHFLALFVVADDRVYLVTCTSLEDSYKQHQPAFQATIDSFKLAG